MSGGLVDELPPCARLPTGSRAQLLYRTALGLRPRYRVVPSAVLDCSTALRLVAAATVRSCAKARDGQSST